MTIPFKPADILLPDFSQTDGTRWSCVACDQYTSEPAYWESADALVGDAPSTLRCIIPEVYLEETADRKPAVLEAMDAYLREVLVAHPDTMILVERTLASGEVRLGLVGMVDLMAYDYQKGAQSLIRATEATVAERIPARTTVRRDAPIELPHVMMLVDDREHTVIEPIAARRDGLTPAYGFDLMQGGGHLRGWFLTPADMEAAETALAALITPEAMTERYGRAGLTPLLFAVGDGNHSLAAAKTCFEEVRAAIGDEAAMSHPARYALCEVVNLYDESLQFEPIYRVVFGVEPDGVLRAFERYISALKGEAAPQRVDWVSGERSGTLTVSAPVAALPVGTVQDFLDEYMKNASDGAYIDYIHGEDTAKSLANRPDAIAFLFDGMAKEELFSTVISDGALPRKTFSMGHAEDKRFYTEARRIR
ncbi:MAG: DUF1015 domain-containing protein [Clostridia bacterium]|nr:DUF1015 domain-containing protein [Clostridia bacterium]